VSAERQAVLGVSCGYHDAAAALVVDGVIVAAVQEERFSRVKGDERLPERSIEYVLDAGGVTPEELDLVVFYESPFIKLDRILSSYLNGDLRALPTFVKAMETWLPEKLWVTTQLRRLLGRGIRVVYGDHHLSHAASAFWPSPFDEAAILTLDGVGEWTTTMIAHGSSEGIRPIRHIEYPNSLGILYSAFTLYCGFKINSGEYKLMGLAPYGTPRFADRIEEELIALHRDGSFSLNPAYFEYFTGTRTYGTAFEELFGAPTRRPSEELSQVYLDVAASIQQVTNRAVLGLARAAAEATGSPRLCLAGGVALNVVAMGELERSGLFTDIWIQPAAGDAGGSLGAALWASQELLGVSPSSSSMAGCFLGPTPGEGGPPLEETLAGYGLRGETLADGALAGRVAELVADGMVVGLARGRMEFGPRALGARSILADPRDPDTQVRLNLKTKNRESFRPFAPIVPVEDAEDYFLTGGRTSPYMLKTYQVRSRVEPPALTATQDVYARVRQVRSDIPAVTHVDHSARVQTVAADENPFLHQVLCAFRARTGCSVLVNTSFNVRGEPIVRDHVDAIECFLRTDIDALVVDDVLLLKSGQAPEALVPRRAEVFGED